MTGAGALQDRKITRRTRRSGPSPSSRSAGWKYWDWNKDGFGPINIYGGFAHSSDTFFYQVAGMLGIDRLAYWAHQCGFGRQTGIDLPGEVAGIVPTNDWKQRVFNETSTPARSTRPASARATTWSRPIQLINAYAALANGGTLYRPQLVRRSSTATATVVERIKPEVIRKLPIDRSVLRTMRVAARNVLVVRHTYNLVDLPIVVAGKSGTAEFGIRDRQGRLPFHSWFVGFAPKDARKTASDPNGFQAVARDRLGARVPRLRATTRGRAGNAAHRDRQVLPAAPLRAQEGRPASALDARARQLLRAVADGHASPRAGQRSAALDAARPAATSGTVFDLQLAVYALALVVIGLLMAFTNSGDAPARSRARCSRAA